MQFQEKETIYGIDTLRMKYEGFYNKIMKGTFVKPVSIVNNGYLHTLNASFDGILLRETNSDSLTTPNQSANFGTMQPCIRTEDNPSQRKSLLHLSLFEILGYSVLEFKEEKTKNLALKTIKEFFTLYTDQLQFDPKLLRVYYFGGGTLKDITKGKINSDTFIEPDDFSADIWRSLGVTDLVKEYSQETFLLHTGKPVREHHSGYRNDIFMKVQNSHFEIATLNFITHQTEVLDNEIIGIKSLPFYLREMAIGQERFIAAIHDTNNLYELPSILPLVEAVTKRVKNKKKAKIYADSLRVVHYTFADGWDYDTLRGKKRKEQRQEVNKFVSILRECFIDVGKKEFTLFLQLNSQLQPWHPQLKFCIDEVINGIEKYIIRAKKNGYVEKTLSFS